LAFLDHEERLTWVHENLRPPSPAADGPKVPDLFAGCGGLGLGFEVTGFNTHGYEMKAVAAGYLPLEPAWRL